MKPTQKIIHIGKSHKPANKAKLAKEYAFANPNKRMNTPYNNR